MTQVAASDYGIVAVSNPVVLTANIQAGVQYPTKAPQTLSWAIVNNSSPFTLIVSQGQVLGHVAAFTADVYAVRSGAPIGLLPLPGSGILQSGTDSTAYVAWYQSNPGGSYPASLGSAGAPFAQTSTVFDLTTTTPAGSFTTVPVFSTLGYGSLRFTLNNNAQPATVPLRVIIGWTDDLGTSTGNRVFIVPGSNGADGGGGAVLTIPHLGSKCGITIFNDTGTNANNVIISVSQSVQTFSQWTSLSAAVAPVLPYFAKGQNNAVAGLGDTVLCSTAYCYAGPAQLSIFTSAAVFEFDLQVQDSQANWHGGGEAAGFRDQLLSIRNPVDAGGFRTVPVLVPAAPLRVRFFNGDAGPVFATADLVADDWRFGG